VWEYNYDNYSKIHLAFLKGRAAIINKDQVVLKEQANFIRSQFEVAIANAALGYLGKWRTGTSDAARAHAIGEGAGFIYSLRFCKLNGANINFSDGILKELLVSPNGFWDITNEKVLSAENKIKAQFKIN
jgi:hypothetical protein